MSNQKSINLKKLTSQVAYWLVFSLLVVVAGIVAVSALNIPGSYKLLVVQSGSMQPEIKLGSVVLVKPAAEYSLNDIITYRDAENQKITITHRIVSIDELEDGKLFITQGDANDAQDTKRVTQESIIGKVDSSIPYVGYLVAFARTQTGLITLIVIPATLIIYSEAMNIKGEMGKMLSKRKTKKRKREQMARAREIRQKILEMNKSGALE